jgi:hypothetical protein
VPAEAVFERYRREIDRANAIVTSTLLGAPPTGWPDDLWPSWRQHDLGEIVPYAITDTACHVGHLDAARELLDGRRGSHCAGTARKGALPRARLTPG